MARKRTKGKAAKKVARKKGTQTGKAAKKPRKPAAKASSAKPAVPGSVESPTAADLLRSWSPSRYTHR